MPIAVGFSCVSKTFTIWQTVLTFSASESKNYTAFDRFHGNSRSVWQNPYQERTNQNVLIYLKTTTLPCIIKYYKTQTELKKATNLLQIHRLRDKCPINIYTKHSKGEIILISKIAQNLSQIFFNVWALKTFRSYKSTLKILPSSFLRNLRSEVGQVFTTLRGN